MTVEPPISRQCATAAPAVDRLDSWKEIAGYLKRGARTVQRWEREENLPVHRLQHEKLGSVYAYRQELDAWWRSRGAKLTVDSPPATGPVSATVPGPSVAVLPFTDMSPGKHQGYFCAGMTEEIVDQLAKLRQLRVAPAESREMVRRMRVGTILEGSVRESLNQLRVAVRLVDAETGFQLWSERYDRDAADVFAVQDEIARHVAGALRAALAPADNPGGAHDCDRRAREYYYRYSAKGIECALQMFLRAIEIDPGFARAYAGLADCWSYLYLYSDRSEAVREQADWASTRALAMSPESPEVHASRGMWLSLSGQNEEADRSFETAQRLGPGLFEAHYFHARHCFALGRMERAAALYESAMQVRTTDYQSPLLAAQVYDYLGRPAEAAAARQRGIQLAEQHLKWNPDDARALYLSANGRVALGDHRRGKLAADRALDDAPGDGMVLYNVGCIYAMLNLVDPSLDCLEKAARSGLAHRQWYQHDSNLDALRGHPRFQRLLQGL